METFSLATGSRPSEPFLMVRYERPKGMAFFLLNRFTRDKTVQIHIWTTGRWASKHIFNHLFNLIFDVLQIKTVIAPIINKNAKAIKLAKQVGFKRNT